MGAHDRRGSGVGLKTRIAITVLVLATLACGVRIADGKQPPSPPLNPSPVVAPIPSGWSEFVVLGDVNVRTCPSTACPSVAVLSQGQTVAAKCGTDWCQVENGYVWANCLIGGKCQSK